MKFLLTKHLKIKHDCFETKCKVNNEINYEKNKIINESKNVIKLNQNKPIEKNMCAVLAISYTTIQNPKVTN